MALPDVQIVGNRLAGPLLRALSLLVCFNHSQRRGCGAVLMYGEGIQLTSHLRNIAERALADPIPSERL